MKNLVTAAVAAATLAGCGTANNYFVEKQHTVEYYRIFDIKTSGPRQLVAKAASAGMGRNVNNAQEANPIPSSSELPEKPGRFKLANPFENTGLAAFAARGGSIGFRLATCEGASWTASAERAIQGSNNLQLTACLFQYNAGYHLDLYAVFTKQEGGLLQISRDMADALVGTPEQWTEKTFLDIVRQIRAQTGAEIALVEGYPEIQGTPWVDSGDSATGSN